MMEFFFPTLFVLAIDLFALRVTSESTSIVYTHLGPVQGQILKTVGNGVSYSAFKSIPYGKPPIGQLRFKPPIFADNWTEVQQTTEWRSDCPQVSSGKYIGDEDCLHLNVFSPTTDLKMSQSEYKAVMVWFSGGMFQAGSANPNFFGPDFLIENDVVVVTVNFRVGPLGFLAMAHPDAMGNVGLKDQNLALIWVAHNIMKFGGDPTKVTIFGQEAGAVSVLYHALSYSSRDYFSGLISMSGTPEDSWGFQLNSDAMDQAIQLGSLLGVETNDKDELLNVFYNVSARNLTIAASQLGSTFEPPFAPVIENATISADGKVFISKCITESFESGDISRVPYILGFMKNETIRYLGSNESISEVAADARSVANNFNISFAAPSVYTDDIDTIDINEFVTETTNLFYVSGMAHTLSYISDADLPVYYYRVAFNPESDQSLHHERFGVNVSGPADADDLPYLWWLSDYDFPLDPKNPISITRSRMTRLWTNFAKYGNPTPDGTDDPVLDVNWPDYGSSGLRLEIHDVLHTTNRTNDPIIDEIIVACAPYLKGRKGCS